MHQPIRDNLEGYLNGSNDGETPQDFAAHLASCSACAEELHIMQQQTQMLRVLRAGGDLEPRAGFYARVMDRIEKQGSDSFWSIFLEPAFGRRLAIASAALVLLLGTYLVSTEPGDHGLTPSSVAVMQQPDAPDVVPSDDVTLPGPDSLQQQRDAVLVNLASYQE